MQAHAVHQGFPNKSPALAYFACGRMAYSTKTASPVSICLQVYFPNNKDAWPMDFESLALYQSLSNIICFFPNICKKSFTNACRFCFHFSFCAFSWNRLLAAQDMCLGKRLPLVSFQCEASVGENKRVSGQEGDLVSTFNSIELYKATVNLSARVFKTLHVKPIAVSTLCMHGLKNKLRK